MSPLNPWGTLEHVPEEKNTFEEILFWLPNRLLDFIDIFRVDAGVGFAGGAVVRVTEYGQAGFRMVTPLSARVGLFGRQAPFLIETSNEMGVPGAFRSSHERNLCTGIVGGGIDLIIPGIHVGICIEEVFDFLAGIVTFDPMKDDL